MSPSPAPASLPGSAIHGLSVTLEQARASMDVVINLLLPYESAIYQASSFLMAFFVIVLVIWTLSKMALSVDGKAVLGGVATLVLVLVMLYPVQVSFNSPALWHQGGQELTDPAHTDQNGTGSCQGLIADADGTGTAPAVPNCGSSYRVSFGALAVFKIANTIEDFLYDAVDAGTRAVAPDGLNMTAGVYEALSIPPTNLADNPDVSRLYRDYIDRCTPVAVADQHSAAPLDPRAWYAIGLLGGGGLGTDLLYLTPENYTTTNITMEGKAPIVTNTSNVDFMYKQADAAVNRLVGQGIAGSRFGVLAPIGWYHIPTKLWWEEYLAGNGVIPQPDYMKMSTTAVLSKEFSPPSNEFHQACERYAFCAVGPSSKTMPAPPTDDTAFYAYDCFDLYSLTHFAFANYYYAAKQANITSYCWKSCGVAGDTNAADVSTLNVMFQATDSIYQEHYNSESGNNNGDTSGGHTVSAAIIAGKSWLGNTFHKLFTLPVVIMTAIGAVSFGLGLLFFLSPLVFVSALLPGRSETIGMWIKTVIMLKADLWLMYVFTSIGSFFIYWTQEMQAAAMWGGGAGQWRYAAMTGASQGLVLGAVMFGAPILGYMLVFHDYKGLRSHAHHHINVFLSAAGGYVVGRTASSVIRTTSRVTRAGTNISQRFRPQEEFQKLSNNLITQVGKQGEAQMAELKAANKARMESDQAFRDEVRRHVPAADAAADTEGRQRSQGPQRSHIPRNEGFTRENDGTAPIAPRGGSRPADDFYPKVSDLKDKRGTDYTKEAEDYDKGPDKK